MIKDRVMQLLEFKRIPKEKFFLDIGMSSSNFRGNASKTPLNSMAIENILSIIPDLNLEWLITGKGEMLKSILVSHKNFIEIPITEIDAAAGFGASNTDYIDYEESIRIPVNMLPHGSRGEIICINVRGESMSPTLPDGSKVIIHRLKHSEWEYIRNDDIYIIHDRGGSSYIKRIKNNLKSNGNITLVSDNPARKYSPFDLQEDEIHNIWAAELFIIDSLRNSCNYTVTKQEFADLQNQIAELKEQVEQRFQSDIK